MFTFLRLALQILLETYSLDDPHRCRVFLTDLVALVGRLARSTETQLDDALLQRIEYVLADDGLYEYLYNLVKAQFSTDEAIFESVLAEPVLRSLAAEEALPESITPAAIINLIAQILILVNSLKKS